MLACRAVDARRRVVDFQNPTANLVTAESCNRKTSASDIKALCQTKKEILRHAFDENVDLAGTAETFAPVEVHQRRLTGSQNFSRAQRHFVFQTSRTQRVDRLSVFAN